MAPSTPTKAVVSNAYYYSNRSTPYRTLVARELCDYSMYTITCNYTLCPMKMPVNVWDMLTPWLYVYNPLNRTMSTITWQYTSSACPGKSISNFLFLMSHTWKWTQDAIFNYRLRPRSCWAWYHDTQELHAIFNVFNNLFFTRCHLAELSNVHSRECVWSGWFEPTHFQGTVRAPTTQQPAVSRPCYLEKQVERWTTCARGSCVGAIHKLGSARAHSQAVQVEGKWTAIDHLRTFASSHGLRTRQSSTQSCSQVPHQREQVTSCEISTRGYPDAKSI